MMGSERMRRALESRAIEIAPLAYMRGRTLNDSVIILDEGQNATVPQMKMFLTRMGQNSRIVVTGDTTQVDLPAGVISGLADAVVRLRDVDGISVVALDKSDIVRHPLVQAIVNAYEAGDSAAGPVPEEEARSLALADPPFTADGTALE
jgi:phosphate starvation-inducible PhoH-like protein